MPSQPGDIAASDTLLSLLLTAALLLHVSAALRRSRRRWRRLVLSATVRGTRIALVSTVLASIGVIASLPGLPTAGLAQTTPTDNQVSITSVGYVPSALTIGPGQTVHWTNNTTGTETVTSSDGLFDSGPIPPSGGFSIAVAEPGAHTYGSSNNSVLRGTITVSGLTGLAGAGTDLARAHIPDQAFPAPAEADISQHPIFGNMVSRTRILVTVAATATVDQVNTAFATAGVDLLGGLPRLGMVLVAAPDTLDLSGLSRALASLRASPAIGNAAMSPQIALDALPTGTIPPDWSWDVVNSSTGAPYGVNGNWNLKASRFPQAWNLLDAVNKKNAPVEVAVVDRGFQLGHPGLAKMVVNEDVCHPPTTAGSKCSFNTIIPLVGFHGNFVSGIIQAADPALQVGGIHAVSTAQFARTSSAARAAGILFDETVELFDLILDRTTPGASLANVRVINYSGHAAGLTLGSDLMPDLAPGHPPSPPLWWQTHPTDTSDPHCGGSFCTPNTDQLWQAEFARIGTAALAVAQHAATQNVLIV